MKILGIETSCDETAAAIVEDGQKILSQALASSIKLHQKTGGIIPEIAAREQLKYIIPIIEETIKNSKLKIKNLNAIAVTVGPGLIGSLLVGVETAKTLAWVWQKPIIPVNHLQAHLYANFLNSQLSISHSQLFPAIGLVVSGGHTDLVFIKSHGQIKWLGGTRDDAAGECFDKTARILGLPYPGGPAISRLAQKGNPQTYSLPRPMLKQKNFDFSFSGLKTAVINLIKKEKKINRADLAASIQKAIVDCLVEKTLRAVKKYQVKTFFLSGGVAANSLLRERLKKETEKIKVNFFVPQRKFCTDNAAMIAAYAHFNYHPLSWQKITANPSLPIEQVI